MSLLPFTAHTAALTDGANAFRFDERGNLVGVEVKGKALSLQPPPLPVSLRVDGKWWHEATPPVTPVAATQRGNRTDITARIADFLVTLHYTLHQGGILQKRITVRYDGDKTPRLDGALFWLPAIALPSSSPKSGGGTDALVLSPSFDFLRVPLSQRPRFNIDMGTGAWCDLYSPSQKLGVSALFYSDTEHFSVNADVVEVSSSRLGLKVNHWLGIQDRVGKGWTAELGTQFFVVAQGSERDLLSCLWAAYDAVGVRPLTDTPKDVFDGALYSTWSDYSNLLRLLPHLKRLGVKTIWLLPYTPGVYGPTDYYAIRPEVGTPEDLKGLVADAHRLNMRVLLDLIPHGPRPESQLAKEHPEWICRDEQGRLIHWWGCYAFDYAHQGWIDYMAKVAAHFAKEFGVDGWRVDVAGGGPPNWAVVKEPFPRRRPSQSGLWGGLRILDEARAEVKAVRGDAIFYPEASGPPFIAHSDIAYEFPLLFVLRRLPYMDEREFVPKLRRWLQHQRYTFPKGGTKRLVRFLENHDFPNAQQVFGIDLAKALFALIASLEGIPFLFEDEDVGAVSFIERAMLIRRRLPSLSGGEADYLDTQVSAPTVFAVHRFTLQPTPHHTLVLVNLIGEPQKVKVRLPQPMAKWKRIGDAWTGSLYPVQDGTVTLTLPCYEPAFLTDASSARLFVPKPSAPLVSQPPPVDISDDGGCHLGRFVTGNWQEGAFKVAPGERAGMETVSVRRSADVAEGKATLKRRLGAVVRTVATLHWRWQRIGNRWRYEGKWQPTDKLKLARQDLTWQFTFVKPIRWRIATVEGTMDEPFIVRRSRPQRIWDAGRILPFPKTSPIFVQLADKAWWTLREWHGGNLQVWVNPDETLTVQIAPDEQGRSSFAFALDRQEPPLPTAVKHKGVTFDGARFVLSTPRLKLTVARNLGGLPIRMEPRNPKRSSRNPVLIGAELYSDYGIFPEHEEGGTWRPEGERQTVRTVGRASSCRVPDKVQLLPKGVVFDGALASSWGGHWWQLSPRINYRLRYETDGDAVTVLASVSPVKTLRRIKAFLAMTLTFADVERVVTSTVKGEQEVSERGERDWQSRQLPLSPDTPKICLHTKAGIVVLDDIAGELQNCFVLKDGDRCTVFFAWLDGERTDFAAAEHPLRFRIGIEP